MGEYSMEVRVKARDLYAGGECSSYEELAAKLAEIFPSPTPSRTQIQRWAQEEGWRDRKAVRRQRAQEFEEATWELKSLLLNKSLELMRTLREEELPLDSQTLHGLVNVAKVILPKNGGKDTATAAPDIDRPALFLQDLEFIANVLKEVDPEGLRVFAKNLDVIVARGKDRYAQTA